MPEITVGGIVLVLEARTDEWKIFDQDAFIEDLSQTPEPRVKEIAGPMINGLIVVTFEIEDDRPVYQQINKAKQALKTVWDRHAARSNNFTLDDGTIVSDRYAKTRIIARLRKHNVDLHTRTMIANTLISPKSGKQGYCVSALERSAVDLWERDEHFRLSG